MASCITSCQSNHRRRRPRTWHRSADAGRWPVALEASTSRNPHKHTTHTHTHSHTHAHAEAFEVLVPFSSRRPTTSFIDPIFFRRFESLSHQSYCFSRAPPAPPPLFSGESASLEGRVNDSEKLFLGFPVPSLHLLARNKPAETRPNHAKSSHSQSSNNICPL